MNAIGNKKTPRHSVWLLVAFASLGIALALLLRGKKRPAGAWPA